MFRRGAHRLVLGFSVCVIALTPACAGGSTDADDPAGSSEPGEFEATFDVERPLGLVAGDGQVWILRDDEGGASLSRTDHTGRTTDVMWLAGQSHDMLPYGDGVVVARVACDGDECEETATKVLVVDGVGKTVAEEEFAREPGPPEHESSSFDQVSLVGVNGDAVWLDTSEGFVSWDPGTGRTGTERPDEPGSEWTPAPRRVELRDYRRPPSLAVAPEPVAVGYGDQVFVLVADGVIRRVVGPPRAPFDEETIEVPADIFFQPYDATATLLFDMSSTVVAGCVVQSADFPAGRCWLRSR